eukprot:14841350-Alexandrium_andersonii.AAC.1
MFPGRAAQSRSDPRLGSGWLKSPSSCEGGHDLPGHQTPNPARAVRDWGHSTLPSVKQFGMAGGTPTTAGTVSSTNNGTGPVTVCMKLRIVGRSLRAGDSAIFASMNC